MVIFHRSNKGCVEMIFRMEENEELPSIDQLMSEIPEFFEDDEDGIGEFEEYSTLDELMEEDPGYFGEE